ncbi:unnamed protein product, partial [Discosporangium mesarthrocarpum]
MVSPSSSPKRMNGPGQDDGPAQNTNEPRSCALLEACCNKNLSIAVNILEGAVGEANQERDQLLRSEDDMRDTPLHLAASSGDDRIVNLLLTNGAEVNAEDNLGSTPLNRAAVTGHVEVIRLLLEHGADLEHLDDISGAALHAAARRNHSESCKILISHGADVNVSDGIGNRPLHLAAAEGAMSALQVLVENGADVSVCNDRGLSPLDMARSSWIGPHAQGKIAELLAGQGT